jgi:hypothetical protein
MTQTEIFRCKTRKLFEWPGFVCKSLRDKQMEFRGNHNYKDSYSWKKIVERQTN